jgi:ParB family chromosome partitioning protein
MDAAGRKQGIRSDLSGRERQDTAQEIADQTNESKRNIFRYLLLTKLTQELLRRVDSKAISVETGGLLSELPEVEQRQLEEIIVAEQVKKITKNQASDLVEHSKSGSLTNRAIRVCLNCIKEPKPTTLTIKICVDDKLNPNEYKHLKKLVKDWQKAEDFTDHLIAWLKKELME